MEGIDENYKIRNRTLDKFIKNNNKYAHYLANRFCKNSAESDNLVQEAFYRMLKNWDKYDKLRPLKPWFRSIMRNSFLDSIKRHEYKNCVSLDKIIEVGDEFFSLKDALPSNETPILKCLEIKESYAMAIRKLLMLRKKQQNVIQLGVIGGLSYRDIACKLSVPIGTVRSLLSRAKKLLRDEKSKATP